jgi:itaconyl-CoA hydratase
MDANVGDRPRSGASYQAGEIVKHRLRRTLTQQDNSWLTLLTLNTAPHFDLTAPNFRDMGGVLMNSCVTLGVVQGICRADFGNESLPNRGFGEIRMTSPVFADDTVRAESEILAVEAYPDGAVSLHVRTRGYKQSGEMVVVFDRSWTNAPDGAWSHEACRRTRDAAVLDPARAFTPALDGPRFADFASGHRYDHGFGRTMLADENIWVSLLHLNSNPHYIDRAFASALDPRGIVIDDTFLLSAVTGMGVKHTTQNAVANLGWKNVVYHSPVFAGDTLYSETEVLGKRRSASRPGQGIVSVRTTGRNQHGRVVLTFERAFLFDADD